jgi:hypothetical protein
MKEITTLGHIDNGILKIHKRKDFLDALPLLNDCRVMVIVRKIYRQRSNPQSGYYWGYINEEYRSLIEDRIGKKISKETAHFLLCLEVNYEEIILPTGEIKRIPMETHTLSTTDFEEFLQRGRDYIEEEFDKRLALPNEEIPIEFKDTEI